MSEETSDITIVELTISESEYFRQVIESYHDFANGVYFFFNSDMSFIFPYVENKKETKKKKVKMDITSRFTLNTKNLSYFFNEEANDEDYHLIKIDINEIYNIFKNFPKKDTIKIRISSESKESMGIYPSSMFAFSFKGLCKIKGELVSLGDISIPSTKEYPEPAFTLSPEESKLEFIIKSYTNFKSDDLKITLQIFPKSCIFELLAGGVSLPCQLGEDSKNAQELSEFELSKDFVKMLKRTKIKSGIFTISYFEDPELKHSLILERTLGSVGILTWFL